MPAYYEYATLEDDTMPPPPTAAQLQSQFQEARHYYGLLKYQQQIDHSYYQLKVRISTPSGYDAVLPPTSRRLVNDAADHVASADPEFMVPRAKQTQNSQETSELIQKWLRAWWYRLNEHRPNPLHRAYTVDMLSKGMGAMHMRWLPERIPIKPKNATKEQLENYENKLRMAFPFEVTVHDPQYIYPDPGTEGQTWVFEYDQRRVGQVQRNHPEWQGWRDVNGKPRNANDPVDWLYYCDRYYRAYLADGQFVTMVKNVAPGKAKPIAHGYGFVPWVIRSGGLGSDSGSPDERYQSLLYIVRGLLDEEMRVWSQGQAIIKDTAWPWTIEPMGVKVDPGSRKVSDVPVDMVDKIKQLRPDAEAPKAVLMWKDSVAEELERATYSSVVTGHAPSGQRSGYSIAVLAGMARVKFGPIKFNAESAFAELATKQLLLIENKIKTATKIWAGGDTDFVLSPRQIAGYERIDCDIQAKLVQDRAADADVGLKLYQSGGLSLETLLRDFAHVDEPLEEVNRRLAEDFMRHPAIQAAVLYEVAKLRGEDPRLLALYSQGTGVGQVMGDQPSGMVQPQGVSSPGGTPAAGPQHGMQGPGVGGGTPGMGVGQIMGPPGQQPSGTVQPQGVSSPGGTPAAGPQHGMEGTVVGGGTPGMGRPSVPGPGPTSPVGNASSGALAEVAGIAPRLVRAGLLQSEVPLG
jgi:hypothetical protein